MFGQLEPPNKLNACCSRLVSEPLIPKLHLPWASMGHRVETLGIPDLEELMYLSTPTFHFLKESEAQNPGFPSADLTSFPPVSSHLRLTCHSLPFYYKGPQPWLSPRLRTHFSIREKSPDTQGSLKQLLALLQSHAVASSTPAREQRVTLGSHLNLQCSLGTGLW